jgi:uncharacterized protein
MRKNLTPKINTTRILWISLILFILMNIVAYFHAYKFTHFSLTETSKTGQPQKLSFTEKTMTILFGVNNPRPENKIIPDQPFETVKLKSNKQIECWLIKSKEHRGTVILFHGYGSDKSSMLGKATLLRDLGYNTLLVDFMGSGGSEGVQTTVGVLEALEVKTAFDFLDSSGERNILLLGTSMGAVAIMRAEAEFRLPAKALILECPFGTLLETVETRFRTMHIPVFPMAHLLVFWGGAQNAFNGFSHKPVQYAKSITCPTLLLYGEKDDKVSGKEIDEIYYNLQGPKKVKRYPLAGHGDYLVQYKTAWEEDIHSFLSDYQKN